MDENRQHSEDPIVSFYRRELEIAAEDAEVAEYHRQAERMGREHGQAAGSWVVDGNSSDLYVRGILDLIANGELDAPAPLSGEFAGDPTPASVLADLGVDEDSDDASDLLDIYETAYYQAYEDEAFRSAQAMAQDAEGER